RAIADRRREGAVQPLLAAVSRARLLRMALGASAALAAVLMTAGCGQAQPGRPLQLGDAALPRAERSRVIVIVMENAEYGEVIGSGAAPFVNRLARRYALASSSFAIGHPSLPNYLALTSGSTQGINSDCTDCRATGLSIVDQLEAAGI